MKPVIFSKHARQRIHERIGATYYARLLLREARLIADHKNGFREYQTGMYKFVLKETKTVTVVVTVTQEPPHN